MILTEAFDLIYKKDPVVLVDRDLVFKLENKNPKLKAINLK